MSRHLVRLVLGAILTLFGAGLIVGFMAGRASAQSPSSGILCFKPPDTGG